MSRHLLVLGMILILTGCATAHQVTQEVGKPIGGTVRVIEGVSEGATEGYTQPGRVSEDNPYGR